MKTVKVRAGLQVHLQPMKMKNHCPISGIDEDIQIEISYMTRGVNVEMGDMRKTIIKDREQLIEEIAEDVYREFSKALEGNPSIIVGVELIDSESNKENGLTPWKVVKSRP